MQQILGNDNLAVIKVVGVGGGGTNAVNRMVEAGIKGDVYKRQPLPFISSGGSSLLSSLALVGVLLSISFDSNNEGEYRQRRDNLQVVSRVSPTDRSGRGGRNSEGRDVRARRSSSLERDGYPSLHIVRGGKAPVYATEVRATRTQRR